MILVLTPTRELCLQVSESFHSYGRDAGIIVTPIYGGQEYGRQIRSLKRGTHVVVATPGRALDHINRGTLKLDAVKAVVLDEADEMLDLALPTNWMPSSRHSPRAYRQHSSPPRFRRELRRSPTNI